MRECEYIHTIHVLDRMFPFGICGVRIAYGRRVNETVNINIIVNNTYCILSEAPVMNFGYGDLLQVEVHSQSKVVYIHVDIYDDTVYIPSKNEIFHTSPRRTTHSVNYTECTPYVRQGVVRED